MIDFGNTAADYSRYRAEQLILNHNPAWGMAGGSGLYPDWLADVALVGFQDIETLSFDLPAI